MQFKVGHLYRFKKGSLGNSVEMSDWYKNTYKYVGINMGSTYGFFVTDVAIYGYKAGYKLSFNLSDLELVRELKSHLPIWF